MSDFLDTENELILVLSAIISVICERIGRSCEIGLIILWLTRYNVFHCTHEKIRVLLQSHLKIR